MTYQRTPEHRQKMSEALTGRKHDYRSASTRPDVAAKIQAYWTPERREAKRLEMLKRNPAARYHGLSAKEAARIVRSVGRCQRCNGDGSESRLGIHHKDRDKKNQRPSNLEVLCHRCHMQEHAAAGETGWQVYRRKRGKAS
jgi:5-methylcytosine-specific restriction endonuclease McrA